MANLEWVSTGEACRILGWAMSTWTFRDNYEGIIPWTKTPGGHYRWSRSAVLEVAALMQSSNPVQHEQNGRKRGELRA